ncbi:MAG: SMC family ATPase [Deltaproteobacteria bacterium]|nr:SMC family ATPase [Deltaproteobacteria bacterium]
MRPLRLVVDGLTCFREPQAVDFTGLGVVAIAGPTGAGKSSLLDAMILALYGLVPRMGKTGVAQLIAHGRKAMSVQLDFRVGALDYRVARKVASDGRPGAAVLSVLDGEREGKKLASGIDEVKRATRALLGIDADAFQQAVILPQGEFQKFLKSDPAARRQTLIALLGLEAYEKMRKRADGIARGLRQEIDQLQARLDAEWRDVTPLAMGELERARDLAAAAVPEAEARAVAAEAEHRRLREEAELTAELAALEVRLAALEAEGRAIEDLEVRKNLSLRVAAILPRLDAAVQAKAERARTAEALGTQVARVADAEAASAVAREAAERARAEAVTVPELRARVAALDQARGSFERRALLLRTRGPRAVGVASLPFDADALARAVALVPTATALARTRAALVQEAQALAREQRLAAQRRPGEATAEAARRDAEVAEVEAARRARSAEDEHRAAALRAGLIHGEVCPVCAQVVTEVPPPLAAPGLAEGRAAAEAARVRADAARAAAQSARAKADEAERNVERLTERVAGLEADIAELEARVVVPAGVGEGPPEARAEAWRLALEAAELDALDAELARFGPGDVAQQRKTLDDAAREREAAERRAEAALAKAEQALAEARTAHEHAADAAARAVAAHLELERHIEALLAPLGLGPEAARAVALTPDQIEALDAQVRAHRDGLMAARERRVAIRERLGASRVSAADVALAEAALEGARRRHGELVAEAARLAERARLMAPQLALAEAARARVKEARLGHEVHARLSEELRSDRFQAYVLEEALADLVTGASSRLLALSGERYGLETDERSGFRVIDLDNAGERRSTDTLSGGETFLASLALALELSEQIQRKAGHIHLESLFIDEGFGTLDPETLDVVATAIEHLGSGGRLVGLITHVAELSARMPHKIRVERGPAGQGSTVRVESGA